MNIRLLSSMVLNHLHKSISNMHIFNNNHINIEGSRRRRLESLTASHYYSNCLRLVILIFVVYACSNFVIFVLISLRYSFGIF